MTRNIGLPGERGSCLRVMAVRILLPLTGWASTEEVAGRGKGRCQRVDLALTNGPRACGSADSDEHEGPRAIAATFSSSHHSEVVQKSLNVPPSWHTDETRRPRYAVRRSRPACNRRSARPAFGRPWTCPRDSFSGPIGMATAPPLTVSDVSKIEPL